MMRVWSPALAPRGRMPGVTSVISRGSAVRSGAISSGEQTRPRTPDSTASRPRRTTCFSGESATPVSARPAALIDVSTVTPRRRSCGADCCWAFAAHCIISRPPPVWSVSILIGSFATDSTAFATVLGMSWSLRSRNTSKPRPATSRTQSGPQAVNISSPTFAQRTVPDNWRSAGATSRGDWASRARIKSQAMWSKNTDEQGAPPPMFSCVKSVTIFAPAKLNLFLAVTGKRADGFHELVSVAGPVDWGDTLTVAARGERRETQEKFSLTCDDANVPGDERNLMLKAALAFAVATGWSGGAKFSLKKRIPMGAGLGGGSSDAVTTL